MFAKVVSGEEPCWTGTDDDDIILRGNRGGIHSLFLIIKIGSLAPCIYGLFIEAASLSAIFILPLPEQFAQGKAIGRKTVCASLT